jgi:hypothetical protein
MSATLRASDKWSPSILASTRAHHQVAVHRRHFGDQATTSWLDILLLPTTLSVTLARALYRRLLHVGHASANGRLGRAPVPRPTPYPVHVADAPCSPVRSGSYGRPP